MSCWCLHSFSFLINFSLTTTLVVHKKQKQSTNIEFSCGTVCYGSSVVTSGSRVAAMAQVQILAWEFPHHRHSLKKKKKKDIQNEFGSLIETNSF